MQSYFILFYCNRAVDPWHGHRIETGQDMVCKMKQPLIGLNLNMYAGQLPFQEARVVRVFK